MNILGIETSTRTGSVALLSERGVIAEYTLSIDLTHSERLMAAVDRVLADTQTAPGGLDGIGVAVGPGSFTGLRIGVAAAKGLAFALDRPLAAVPTLKALAAGLPQALYPVCPLLDAKKKEVYAAVYRLAGNEPVPEMPERVLSLASLAEAISGPVIFTAEGAHLFRDELLRLFGDRARFAPLAASAPSAAVVAELALGMIAAGQVSDPDQVVPQYIRRAEAEVAWEQKHRSS